MKIYCIKASDTLVRLSEPFMDRAQRDRSYSTWNSNQQALGLPFSLILPLLQSGLETFMRGEHQSVPCHIRCWVIKIQVGGLWSCLQAFHSTKASSQTSLEIVLMHIHCHSNTYQLFMSKRNSHIVKSSSNRYQIDIC
jgi:hypothetical protein